MDWLRKSKFKIDAFILVLAITMLTLMFASGSIAQTVVDDQSNDKVSIKVFDATLKNVIQLLIRESNKDILIADQDKMDKVISLSIADKPFETALKNVALAAGCGLTKDEDGIYILTSEPIIKNENPVSVPVAANINESDMLIKQNSIYTAARSTKTEKIELINTAPSEMMWILGLYNIKDAAKIQKAKKFKPAVSSPNRDGLFGQINVSSEASPVMSDRDIDSSKRSISPSDEELQMGGIGGRTSGMTGTTTGGGTFGATGTMGGGVGNIGGGAGNFGTGGLGQSLVPEGIEFVMPYELDNTVIVRGEPDAIDELKSIIAQLDIAPRQLMIKAEFVEIDTTAASSLGINWQVERLGGSMITNFSVPNNISVGYANGNVIANLMTQISNSKAKLINAPLISTLNNVPASISIGTDIPYFTSTTFRDSNGNPTTETNVDFVSVTTELFVLPRINNADNSITVYLEPTISDSPGSVDTPSGSVPIVSEQALTTTRRVQNGETIVIGGIIRKNETMNITGIPLLKDLPIIGQIFTTRSKVANDRELLIFLTPSIVPEKPVAGSGIGVTP